MIDIAWIKAQQARATAMPDKRITLPMSEFNELLALAARTASAETQLVKDAAGCEFTKNKMARQVMDLDTKCDRLAKALEIIQYEAECGVACEDEREVAWYVKRCRVILAAIASAKGDQP